MKGADRITIEWPPCPRTCSTKERPRTGHTECQHIASVTPSVANTAPNNGRMHTPGETQQLAGERRGKSAPPPSRHRESPHVAARHIDIYPARDGFSLRCQPAQGQPRLISRTASAMTPRHARKNRSTLWSKQAKDLMARTCLVDRNADRVAGAQAVAPLIRNSESTNRRDVELAGNSPGGYHHFCTVY